MFQIKAKLISNKRIKGDYWHCVLNAPVIAKQAKAGQFLSISLDDDKLLLRRPFSIHRVKGLNLEIIYEVLGKGTASLSRKKSGQQLDIIGPLGNGFDYKTPGHQDTRAPVLVAGGMGVAPLVFLAEKLAVREPNTEYRTPLVLIGAKTRNHILCEKEFKELGFDVKIATDDGSRGFKGYVSELLEQQLLAFSPQLSTIYACGPKPMFKEVCWVGKKYRLPVQVSLEEHMACGIGACFGCAVDTKEGYKRVCKEGPVFRADDLIW
ncbi:MAG: dihydroorotate dehydrogenase electron transfer subunit [Candidatus Omnitrophota bacterium]